MTERSVDGLQYGQFLVDVFEEWVRRDVGKVFVQLFDVTLEAFFGRHLLCIHAPTCGYGPALEHNGDLYSCDHFVEPKYKLGNIHETHMLAMVASPEQREFGLAKRDTLTAQCRECKVRPLVQRRLPEGPLRAVARRRARARTTCAAASSASSTTPGRRSTRWPSCSRRDSHRPQIMETIAELDARRSPDAPCPCGNAAGVSVLSRRRQTTANGI